MEKLTMSKKELEQLVVFERLKNREITQVEAAKRLGLTTRWIRIKMARFRAGGAVGLRHGNRGKPSKNRWNAEDEVISIDLLKAGWQGFGATFASEKLEKLKGIKVSRETLRKSMIRAGLLVPKKKRAKHRQRRERRPMFGIMAQFDGSPHDWFEGRGPWCTLLVFIDDATSEVLWLEFAKSESRQSTMLASKHYIETWGIPHIIYVDHGGSFHVNLNNTEGDKKTHWEIALESLGIEIIHANSPQAKGRVERANGTLQDRLVKEMRLVGVSSIEAANKFLHESSFISDYNELFGKRPNQQGDAHRPLTAQNLETVFCAKETRTLANDFTIQHAKRIFQLSGEQKTAIRPKDKIVVSEHLDDKITLSIRDIQLSFKELKCRSQKPAIERKCAEFRPAKPCENSKRFVSGLPPKCKLIYNYSAQGE